MSLSPPEPQCERLFVKKKSDMARTKRPEFEATLTDLRSTDVQVVWKLNRLGHSIGLASRSSR